ncbi:hypothetical protein AQUCO_09900010v1 [Aquilegia coerulea]|uniref:WAPL domain-containing protein n=1 Tax=Aquilegia coerulea TaxID=218851 RepID=A0A2G5C4G4_AQUCA|nr:hypothetical protein AQUCO_09900010v1 [Aquilegia coerulea]
MIVRTYGRKNRFINTNYSDSEEIDSISSSSSSQQPLSQDVYNFSFSSSQDSCPWSTTTTTFSESQSQSQSQQPPLHQSRPPLPNSKKGVSSKLKKSRNLKVGRSNSMPVLATSTLMEAQEFGEMMKHVDEVNFALDGLKKKQPARIRRASLLSLLLICGTIAQRRLLRTQG